MNRAEKIKTILQVMNGKKVAKEDWIYMWLYDNGIFVTTTSENKIIRLTKEEYEEYRDNGPGKGCIHLVPDLRYYNYETIKHDDR